VATFSGLTLNKAASGYTLVVTSSGLGEGVTNAITVTPAAASKLVITQQPPGTVKVNTGFGFQASIEDTYGNVVTTAGNTVKVAFANNPTGATLGGTLTVTASQGVAAFSGLTINKVGSGYTLQVTSSGLSSAVTNAINVTKNGGGSAPSGATATGPIGLSSDESRGDPAPASLAIGPIAPAATPSTTLHDPGLVAQALDTPGLLDGWPPGRRRR
jgi:hypothetical protein